MYSYLFQVYMRKLYYYTFFLFSQNQKIISSILKSQKLKQVSKHLNCKNMHPKKQQKYDKIYVYENKLQYFLIYLEIQKIGQEMISAQQFIGKFENQNYTITKDYIDTEVDQIRLYHTRYVPKNPKYTICIVHGFGEHSTRFKTIADFYARNQFQVLTVDLRGFGYSGGARGCAELRELQNDVIAMLKTARSDLPLFIYGHSLGGLITIKLLLDKPELNVSGCIITSPLLGLAKNMHFNWIKKKFMYYLGDHLADFIVNSRVNPTALTKKTKYLHTIFDDRLMIPFMSVKMAKYLFEGLDEVKAKASTFRYPIIIFHGKQDTVTNVEDSKEFVYKNVRPYKQYFQFPNGYHEMQHDGQKDQMLEKSLQFIGKLPELKNFGLITVHPIRKQKPKSKISLKAIIILIGIVVLIIKLRAKYLKK